MAMQKEELKKEDKEGKVGSVSKETEAQKKELIEIYENYIKDSSDNSIKQRAQKIFINYTSAAGTMDRELMDAIWGLEHIGYDYGRGSQKGIWKLTIPDAQKILEKLKR